MVSKGEGVVWPGVSWRWAIMAVAVVARAHNDAYRAASHCDAARAMGLARSIQGLGARLRLLLRPLSSCWTANEPLAPRTTHDAAPIPALPLVGRKAAG